MLISAIDGIDIQVNAHLEQSDGKPYNAALLGFRVQGLKILDKLCVYLNLLDYAVFFQWWSLYMSMGTMVSFRHR